MATEGPSTAGSLPGGPPHVAPLLPGPDYVPVGHDFRSVTEAISDLVLKRPTGMGWLGLFGFSQVMVFIFLVMAVVLLVMGVGI